MTFKINPDAEKQIADMAIRAITAQFQPVLDSIHEEYQGQSVDVIKPVLATRWGQANDGASIAEPDLTNVAQAISDGKRVVMVDGRPTTEQS